VVITDPVAFAFDQVLDLVPSGPVQGIPADVALVPPPGGGTPDRAYVIDHFRETIRPIQLAGTTFTLQPEIALAHSHLPREPLTDLSQDERGEYLFWGVLFFNGTPAAPNPVSCNTCHTNLFSDNVTHSLGRQCQPMFAMGAGLAPFGWNGDVADLKTFTKGAFNTHGKRGGTVNSQMLADLTAFQEHITEVPANPFLDADGSLSDAAERGKTLFDDPLKADCVRCHAPPLYVPLPTDPPTIAGGVGTGLVPANVPTLLGLWSTAPYFNDGSAPTLLDVLLRDTSGLHGNAGNLTAQEQSDLIEFLKSL
jgi:hypothetical protein